MTDKILRADSTAIANIRSVTWKEQVNNADNLRFGCCAASSIEFDVFGAESTAPAVGEQLTYIHVAADSTETTIGIFTAQPAIPSKNTYHVIAYDNIIKLETDFSATLESLQSSFPMTLATLVGHVCTTAGVTLKSSAFPMASTQIAAFSATGISCRDVMSWAAEIAGCFVRCDNTGKVEFAQYATRSGYKVYKTSGSSGGVTYIPYKQDGLTYSNYNVAAVDLVAVHPPAEEDVAYLYPNGANGNTYTVNNNLLLTNADSTVFTAVATNIYNTLDGMATYCAAEINLFREGNPLRAGDVIAVEDAQGVSFTTLVMALTCTPSGITVSCTAHETYDADRGSSVGKQLINLANNIVRINKLKVDWAEINTAIINYLTAYDVTAQNLTIVDANDNVIATFNDGGITFYSGGTAVANYNSSTVTLGEIGSTHAEIDYNTFELYDMNRQVYTSIGDMRDASGYAELTETVVTTSAVSSITMGFSINSIESIEIDGVATTAYTFSDRTITFTNTIASGSTVVIVYKTGDRAYHFDLGDRTINSNIGAWSIANGHYIVASGGYSTVSGGLTNTASGYCATVSGGTLGVASGNFSSIGGGGSNTASGLDSTIGGGYSNTASGDWSAVCGGAYNTATKYSGFVGGGEHNTASHYYSSVLGGAYNTASGQYSSVLGGNHNEAHRKSQTVFGEYNVVETGTETTRGTYIEIVGNGTTDNARSNARTLDWSGNEKLAGNLYVNGSNKVAIEDDVFYKSGDTFTCSSMVVPCLVLSSAAVLKIQVTTPKSMKNVSTITINSIKGGVRLPGGGYLDGNSDTTEWTTNASYTFSKAKSTDNSFYIGVSKSTAFTGGVTNSCAAMNLTLTVTFS